MDVWVEGVFYTWYLITLNLFLFCCLGGLGEDIVCLVWYPITSSLKSTPEFSCEMWSSLVFERCRPNTRPFVCYYTIPIQSNPIKHHSHQNSTATSMMNDEQVIKSQPKVSYLLFNHCFPGKRQKKPQGMYEKDMTSYV